MLSDDKKLSHVITTQAGDLHLHFNYFTEAVVLRIFASYNAKPLTNQTTLIGNPADLDFSGEFGPFKGPG